VPEKYKHSNLLNLFLTLLINFIGVNFLGGTCDENAQCTTTSSECKLVGSDKVCSCMSGMVTSGNTCLLSNFSRFCFFSIFNALVLVADEIGASCRIDDQCGWENSECSGLFGAKTCTCKSDYVSSITKQSCLRSRYFNLI
jgi:hypothetical protein